MSDEIRQKLKQVSKEGKITCAQAEKIAEENGLSRLQVGKIINELELKITSCQLGCF
jgi:LAO/AO transport system kinase